MERSAAGGGPRAAQPPLKRVGGESMALKVSRAERIEDAPLRSLQADSDSFVERELCAADRERLRVKQVPSD